MEGADLARVSVGSREATASLHGAAGTLVLLGHGAGGTRATPFLVRFAESLAARGRRVALHNFLYSEERRRSPDRAAVLEATAKAWLDWARREAGTAKLVAGGKSMGGRMASQAIAAGAASADALVFLGFPLHPPGQPEKRRDEHLYRISVPMLFVQGTRDDFARFELLEEVLARLGERATLLRIDDGDHSFKVRKRETGKSESDVEREIVEGVEAWLERQRM
jgi:predicted alpha/beta-hydrolase family hydrolase